MQGSYSQSLFQRWMPLVQIIFSSWLLLKYIQICFGDNSQVFDREVLWGFIKSTKVLQHLLLTPKKKKELKVGVGVLRWGFLESIPVRSRLPVLVCEYQRATMGSQLMRASPLERWSVLKWQNVHHRHVNETATCVHVFASLSYAKCFSSISWNVWATLLWRPWKHTRW